MKVQVREFRETFSNLSERTDVFSRNDLKGTWFPGGHECAQTELSAAMGSKAELVKQIEALEEDNRQLKRLLAARSRGQVAAPSPGSKTDSDDPLSWLSKLPKQDQEFFARRLGKKK